MEEDDLLWVLGAFPQPVFLTDGETVQWRNAAASAVLDPGASLQPMLQGTAFGLWSRRGTLRLSLPFGGALCDFSVRAMQRGLLFLADAPHEPSAAAGAALTLSDPLSVSPLLSRQSLALRRGRQSCRWFDLNQI